MSTLVATFDFAKHAGATPKMAPGALRPPPKTESRSFHPPSSLPRRRGAPTSAVTATCGHVRMKTAPTKGAISVTSASDPQKTPGAPAVFAFGCGTCEFEERGQTYLQVHLWIPWTLRACAQKGEGQ